MNTNSGKIAVLIPQKITSTKPLTMENNDDYMKNYMLSVPDNGVYDWPSIMGKETGACVGVIWYVRKCRNLFGDQVTLDDIINEYNRQSRINFLNLKNDTHADTE